ncbi:MAG: hypothetical protein FJ267_10980, partial [Planctomycetes bacterium]|nr:hypothetical protein [Planctomycetota bacterium]
MYESMSSLFEQLRDHVSQLTWSELLLRIALIGCSLFAMIQLMTMMGTRYGDKNASVKSFYLSLLLHCCFGLGWATVVQSYPPQSPTTSENVERPEIQVTFANETESPEESGSGQVPVWINQAEADQPDRSRVDRAANEPEPPEELVVEKSPEKPPIPAELPDLNSSVEEVPVTPVPETVADSNSRTPVPPTMTIDSPKTEARRDVGGNVPAMRQTLSRETVNSEPTLSVEPQRRQPKEIGPVIDSP